MSSSTPRPSQKKQASLTSFFTPKSAANGTSKTPSRPSIPPSSSPVHPPSSLPSRKRPLEEDPDQGNNSSSGGSQNSSFQSAIKRARAEASDNENDAPVKRKPAPRTRPRKRAPDPEPQVEPEPEPEPEPEEELPATPRNSSPLRSSGRTERYLYEGKRQQTTARQDTNPQDNDMIGQEEEEEDDPETKRKKEELHRKFVKKLGHPDSLAKFRRRTGNDNAAATATEGDGDGDGEGEDDDDEEERPPAKGGSKKKAKLTPMLVQILDIKRKHPDTILVVEVGYKFRFFGEDARKASRALGIMCVPGKMRYDEHISEAHLDRFASASFPTVRLEVNVRRLVAAGYKVGVVRQMETAALKKVGDNRNAPFVRKLTNVYTKGTYIDDVDEPGADQGTGAGSSGRGKAKGTAGGYLLCLTESPAHGAGTDEKVDVGILAVQPGTGDIIYDSFEDGFMRNEIETRLLHISPCELLIVGELSRTTEKLVQHLSGSAANVFGDQTRVERVPRSTTMETEAYSHVTRFYADMLGDKATGQDGEKDRADSHDRAHLLDEVLHLPGAVTVCLSAMIAHLTEYGLEHIFDLTKYFTCFTTRQHMLLNGTTLESLEVYRNATDHSLRGSLLWALDKTQTRFGHRLLRKWIGSPLLDRGALETRSAAVEELVESVGSAHRTKLERLLSGTKTDLERSLIRIYYGKCTRPELLAVLQALQRIATEYSAAGDNNSGFSSPLLRNAVAAIPAIQDTVISFLDKINGEAARKDDKYAFFRESEETEDISNHKVGIVAVEMDLEDQRTAIGEALAGNKPTKRRPAYTTVAGIEYLVEVPNADLKRVPASWIKISGTKKMSRFHTPAVVRLISERDQHKEALAAACDEAFADMLRDLAAQYQPLRDAVAALATLDCLLSLAKVAALPGYVKPTLLPTDAPPTLDIQGGRHPVAEHTLPSGYIPFSARLASPAPKALLITGPNMGGKSSFVRAVALLTLLAQIGSYVPADAMELTLADAIFTRMGARDNLFAGESTFMVEVSETAAILRAATPRSLVVLDELGRGTSTHDGAAIAQAVLEHVARETGCLTLFITHYQSLGRVADGLGPPAGLVQNVHMKFTANKRPGDDSTEEITFLYEVGRGVAHRSYGLNVARLAHMPQRVLDVAAQKSREMEEDVCLRRLRAASSLVTDVLTTPNGADNLDHLVSSIEQL